MSNNNALPSTIPSKEIPFTLQIIGSTTQHTYNGDFIVKVPSVRDMSRVGVCLARLNFGVSMSDLDTSTANLNNAIAFLQVCLVDAPKWFTNAAEAKEPGISFGLDTLDINVPVEIFRKANELVDAWHVSLKASFKSEQINEKA